MTKTLESPRLLMAAVDVRDNLRMLAIPGIDQAIKMAENADQREALRRVRDIALRSVESLRFAVKDRHERPRQNNNAPAWSDRRESAARYLPKHPRRALASAEGAQQ
jgi:hypothetical protein